MERIKENSYAVKFSRFAKQAKPVKVIRVKGSLKDAKKIGGLRGLYLHYCYMECHRGYSRCGVGYRACPARPVLCGRRDAYLRQLCRGEASRAGVEAVYPLCPRQRCSDLWLGADDGSV